MAENVKIKKGSDKICTKCYNPQYIKFNFAYFSNDINSFSNETKAQFVNRMLEVSQIKYVSLMQKDKSFGFEIENVDIRKQIPSDFLERFPDKRSSKLTIMRLYKKDHPIVGRIVGIIIHHIFYVFYLFVGTNQGYKR